MSQILASQVHPRLTKALARLREACFATVATLGVEQRVDGRWKPIATFPHHWGRLWSEAEFRVTLPGTLPDDAWLAWNDQAESTAYLDGRPWTGFDVAHRRSPLPAGARVVELRSICAQTGIWHPGATGLDPAGSRLEPPAILARDKAAWDATHDLLVLLELLHEEALDAGVNLADHTNHSGGRPDFVRLSVLGRRLLRGLDLAVDALDRGGPAACAGELARLRSALRGSVPFRNVLTGHAHIDLVWLWPERIGELKAVHTFTLADELLGRYPEMTFGYSQPASYEAVFRREPALADRVRARIAEGRWEPVGALHVESDTQLPCGEALARSLVLGQQGFRALTGRPSDLVWLPDCFGFSPCLPQLARLAGVSRFFTCKAFWSSVTTFPYQAFRWVGNDGSCLTSYAHFERRQGYNGDATVRALRDTARMQRQAAEFPEALVPTGYGDGGGGVTDEMLERARRTADLAGVPATAWGRIGDFFDRLEAAAPSLPEWHGEIYLQYHRGVQTSWHRFKRAFRALERALQAHEAAAVVAGTGPIPDHAWRRLVFMQFHDFVPGSSILAVYEEGIAEAERLAREARAEASRLLGAGRDGTPCLFNPLALPLGVALGDGARGTLPPLAGLPAADVPRVARDPSLRASASGLANGRIAVAFNPAGEVASVSLDGKPWDLAAGGELTVAPDHPHQYDAWDIDHPAATRLAERVAATAVLLEAGVAGDTATVRFSRDLGPAGHVEVSYVAHAGEPRLHVTYAVDWKAPRTLLRSRWRTAFRGRNARFGAPFGSTLRPQLPAGPADESYWEVPGSRWALVADDGEERGWWIATEDLYGFSAREGTLGVSLLRTPLITAEDTRRSHPPSLRDDVPAQPFADLGKHVLRMVVGPWTPDLAREDRPAAVAETAFAEPIPYRGPAVDAGFGGLEGCPSLVPAAAVPTGTGWTLRLHETLGRRGRARLLGEARPDAAVDLLGNPDLRPGVLDPAGATVHAGPYQVLSLAMTRG